MHCRKGKKALEYLDLAIANPLPASENIYQAAADPTSSLCLHYAVVPNLKKRPQLLVS